jgi:hypothetical protein
MELYRRARGVLPSVFTFIRTVDQNNWKLIHTAGSVLPNGRE